MQTIEDVVYEANRQGLLGNKIVGIIYPTSATSNGYSIVIESYVTKSVTDLIIRR